MLITTAPNPSFKQTRMPSLSGHAPMPPANSRGIRVEAVLALGKAWLQWALVTAAVCLLCSCATAPRTKTESGPLLEAAAGLFYLDPSKRERSQADVLGSFVMLGALSEKYDRAGCEKPECKHDFADILRTLGMAYSRLGLHRLSLRYYELALANDGGSAQSHADVAIEQLALGRDEASLASLARALELDKRSADIEQQAAGIYLLTDHAQDAVRHAEACLRLDPPPRRAQYCAIGLALAKLRGASDSLLLPLIEPNAWPGPLLLFARGEIDEATLARMIALAQDPADRRERLAEALYYAGEVALARGQPERALRYFRTNQTMKAEGYWETMASRRRILQLHGNADEPEPEIPVSHIPIG